MRERTYVQILVLELIEIRKNVMIPVIDGNLTLFELESLQINSENNRRLLPPTNDNSPNQSRGKGRHMTQFDGFTSGNSSGISAGFSSGIYPGSGHNYIGSRTSSITSVNYGIANSNNTFSYQQQTHSSSYHYYYSHYLHCCYTNYDYN